MVHNAVAKARGADLAPLRFVNEEVRVGAGRIDAVEQFLAQLHEAVGHLKVEGGDRCLASLAQRRAGERLQQVRP